LLHPDICVSPEVWERGTVRLFRRSAHEMSSDLPVQGYDWSRPSCRWPWIKFWNKMKLTRVSPILIRTGFRTKAGFSKALQHKHHKTVIGHYSLSNDQHLHNKVHDNYIFYWCSLLHIKLQNW
jgi:hypothetical protein